MKSRSLWYLSFFCSLSLLSVQNPVLLSQSHTNTLHLQWALLLLKTMLSILKGRCLISLLFSSSHPPLPSGLCLNALFLCVGISGEIRSPGHVTFIDRYSLLCFFSELFLLNTVTRVSVIRKTAPAMIMMTGRICPVFVVIPCRSLTTQNVALCDFGLWLDLLPDICWPLTPTLLLLSVCFWLGFPLLFSCRLMASGSKFKWYIT